MKIAIVHDYLKEYGGAERVLEALYGVWPEAPIFTLVYSPRHLGPHQARLKKWNVKPLIPQWFYPATKLISPLRLLAPMFFRNLDLSNYDVVLVSATGAYNPNLIKTKKVNPSKVVTLRFPPFFRGRDEALPRLYGTKGE